MKLTAQKIQQLADQVFHLHQEIHRTFQNRCSGKRKDYFEWKTACENYHSHRSELDKLWSDEFADKIRLGNREAINELILFLEVDPFYFRSGYLKERLLRLIKNAPRTKSDNRRLRGVIWNRASGPNRREFRSYCQLAKRITTQDFRHQVFTASRTKHASAKGKFSFLLNYLAS